LSLAYYLLPAIAVTLKVRKRKLNIQKSTPDPTSSVLYSKDSISFQTLGLIDSVEYALRIDEQEIVKELGVKKGAGYYLQNAYFKANYTSSFAAVCFLTHKRKLLATS
jgi:hypothetical protein